MRWPGSIETHSGKEINVNHQQTNSTLIDNMFCNRKVNLIKLGSSSFVRSFVRLIMGGGTVENEAMAMGSIVFYRLIKNFIQTLYNRS